MPEDWETVALSDLCIKICSGGTPASKRKDYYGGGIPWLNTKEVDFNFIENTEKTITNDGLAHSSAKWIKPNSVIVAMYGATAGRVAITKIPLTTNQACCNLEINGAIADYRFIYYWLKNSFVYVKSLANGGAQQNLNAQMIKDLEIRLPALKVQEYIADILSVLDNKIENNKRINHHLLEQAIAIHKYFCVELVDDTFVTETVKSISNEVVTGKTPSTKIKEYYGGSLPFITIPDMHGNVFCVETARYLTNVGEQSQQRKTLPAKSIAVSCIATPGLVCLLDRPSQTNQQINSVIPKENQEYYLFLELLSKSQLIIELGSSGSTTYNLNKTQFEKIEILATPIEKRGQINQMLSPLFDELNHIQHENNRLIELRDTLLPKLMSGELSVSQAAK